MRKRYRILLLATIVAALVVPVGYALSLESQTEQVAALHQPTASPPALDAARSVSAPIGFASRDAAAVSWLPPIPDGAKLLVVGTLLFGLAAAVRRATE